MFERIWDFFVDSMMAAFMPLVCSYFTLTNDLFLNVAVRDAKGLEWAGNALLSPVHYLLVGKEAIQNPDGSWQFVQRFDYSHAFWFKTASSIAALPASAVLGSIVKGLSFFQRETRQRFASLKAIRFHSNLEIYRSYGIKVEEASEFQISEGHLRRPGDEGVLRAEKEALRDIGALLTRAHIPWWIDCGTCLGAHRYGGAIPWDQDVDLAVLQDDFENVLAALSELDRTQYLIQDWSTRDYPNSYIKVFIRKSGTMVDIYHFKIVPEKKQFEYIFSLDRHFFFPEWFKIRERRFLVPVAFDTVFPLKKMLFDGIEVFVPHDTKKYLQRCYGDNLSPAKIYDPVTNRYEKDLNHPYWQRTYAH